MDDTNSSIILSFYRDRTRDYFHGNNIWSERTTVHGAFIGPNGFVCNSDEATSLLKKKKKKQKNSFYYNSRCALNYTVLIFTVMTAHQILNSIAHRISNRIKFT